MFQMNDDFEKSIENLSPRAQRVIADLGVKDADSLVGISQDNLEGVRMPAVGKAILDSDLITHFPYAFIKQGEIS
jgi:hypothetical protein